MAAARIIRTPGAPLGEKIARAGFDVRAWNRSPEKAGPLTGDGATIASTPAEAAAESEAILTVLEKGRVGEKYNIGGGNERTNLEVVDRICDLIDELKHPPVSCHTLKTFVPDRPGHDRRYAIDASRIRRELGWAPRHSFESGLRETVRWYLDHRGWCDEVQAGRYDRQRLGLG